MPPDEELESKLKFLLDRTKSAANVLSSQSQSLDKQQEIFNILQQTAREIKSTQTAFSKLSLDCTPLIEDLISATLRLNSSIKQYYDLYTTVNQGSPVNPSIVDSALSAASEFKSSVIDAISQHTLKHIPLIFLETIEAKNESASFSQAVYLAIDEASQTKAEMIDFIEKNQASLAGISFFKQQKEHRSRQYWWFASFLAVSACTATLIVGLGCANIPLPAAGPMAIPSIWDYFTIAKRAAFVVLALSALSVGMKITFNQFISERKIADIYRNKISIIQHFRTAIRSQTDEATKNAMHLELMKTLYADIPYSSQDHNMEFNVAPVMNIAESLTKKATDK